MKEAFIASESQTAALSETPISRLGLSSRFFKALAKSGYDTVAKVLDLDEEVLAAIENLSKKKIKRNPYRPKTVTTATLKRSQ